MIQADPPGEEKIRLVSSSQPAPAAAAVVTPTNKELTTNESTCTEASCTDMLETVDSCVDCMNQVGLQQDFEETHLADLPLPALRDKPIAPLSETEAALLRFQVMEEEEKSSNDQKKSTSHMPDMDLLNLCGSEPEHDEEEEPQRQQPKHSTATTAQSQQKRQKPQCCAVCSEQAPCTELPCCKKAGVCGPCIQHLTYPAGENNQSRAGRCPLCRTWITLPPRRVGHGVASQQKEECIIL